MRHNRLLTILMLASLSACAPLTPKPDQTDTLQTAYLSAQSRIENQLSNHPSIRVSRREGNLIIHLPAADGFAAGDAKPTQSLRSMLAELTALLKIDDSSELLVLGHTDSIGSEIYNLRLSIARAEAVMDELRQQGIALARLAADGRGEAEPIADNATEEGRALNRRVEIVLRPQ